MRVLIVDDDPGIREIMSLVLREEGYTVLEAMDGSEALQQMCATTEPMLVFLDVWMPGMDGEAALAAVLAQDALWSRLSFVVMTANLQRMTARMHEMIDQNEIPLLLKPFDLDAFADLARSRAQLLSGALVERESGSLS